MTTEEKLARAERIIERLLIDVIYYDATLTGVQCRCCREVGPVFTFVHAPWCAVGDGETFVVMKKVDS